MGVIIELTNKIRFVSESGVRNQIEVSLTLSEAITITKITWGIKKHFLRATLRPQNLNFVGRKTPETGDSNELFGQPTYPRC